MIDRSWFMQESPVLNPDWFGEIRLLSKNYLPYYHIKYVQKLCCRLEGEMLDNSFWCFICCLILNIGTMFPFFWSPGNIPQFKQFSKIVRRGSAIASTNIFNIQILIRSWSWALLGSSLQIIILKSSFVYLIFDRQWSIMGLADEGRRLLLLIIEHYFRKKEFDQIFTKLYNKFLIMNNSLDWRISLLLNIIILKSFQRTCFRSSSGFHISSFAAFQIWLLKCYFYFSSKANKFCFLSSNIILILIFIQRCSQSLKILFSWGIKLPWWY